MMISSLLFAAGLLLGSFYYLAGIRIPLGGRSIGASLLRNPTGIRASAFPYLLTIVATGLIFTSIPHLAESSEWLIAYIFTSMLIILSVCDLKYKLLPNKIIYPGLILFLLLRLFLHPLPIWHYAIGFLIGGGSLLAVSFISLMLRRSAMGGGDIKLMAFMGLVLGVKLVLLTIFLSSLLGCLTGMIGIASGKMKRDTVIAYGPFIAIGGIIAYFVGEHMLNAYFSFVFNGG